MRTVKAAEERRNEILDAAERLFASRGFDSTSITDIQKEIGIDRGTLYYHFKSKEDILDGMIRRITQELAGAARAVAAQKDIPLLQRLTVMIRALQTEDALGHEILEQVHKPQNALMHQKMQEELSAGLNAPITALIEEGIAQGICRTKYPAQVVDMTLLYVNTAFDSQAEQGEKERRQKTDAFIYNLESLQGMEEGSLRAALKPLFEREQSPSRQTETL